MLRLREVNGPDPLFGLTGTGRKWCLCTSAAFRHAEGDCNENKGADIQSARLWEDENA